MERSWLEWRSARRRGRCWPCSTRSHRVAGHRPSSSATVPCTHECIETTGRTRCTASGPSSSPSVNANATRRDLLLSVVVGLAPLSSHTSGQNTGRQTVRSEVNPKATGPNWSHAGRRSETLRQPPQRPSIINQAPLQCSEITIPVGIRPFPALARLDLAVTLAEQERPGAGSTLGGGTPPSVTSAKPLVSGLLAIEWGHQSPYHLVQKTW